MSWRRRRRAVEESGLAKAGEVLEIPMAGRIVFRQTGGETNGELLEFDFFLPVGQESAQAHVHPRQDERFDVVSGRVRGEVGGEERTAGPGESAEMPAGTPHLWWNDGDKEAHLLVQVRPALRTEEFYETMERLSVGEEGIPSKLHAAVVMREYKDEFRIAMFSGPVKGALIILMAAIGRLRGYKA
jgi:quercetin dioxygenase-like cupin family protein